MLSGRSEVDVVGRLPRLDYHEGITDCGGHVIPPTEQTLSRPSVSDLLPSSAAQAVCVQRELTRCNTGHPPIPPGTAREGFPR